MANPNDGNAWTRNEAPFHEGELTIQGRLGVETRADRLARRLFFDHIPAHHRDFFATLSYCFVGTVDKAGWPRATMLCAEPGFLNAPSERQLDIKCAFDGNDPAAKDLERGSIVGILAFDTATRARFRTNGIVTSRDGGELSIAADMSYPNCPQYVQARSVIGRRANLDEAEATTSDCLDDRWQRLVGQCDLFFIASAAPVTDNGIARGADISHRGGNSGFVRVDNSRTLTVPDFAGNFIFNTLGNLTRDPRAGLLFIDFETGDALHVSVRAEIVWEGEELEAFVGAERLVRFHIEDVVLRPGVMPLIFSEPEFSPVLARIGSWSAASRTIEANREKETWRPFVVHEKVQESDSIASFILTPTDGGGVVSHEAGQHLPISLVLPDGREEIRTYTVSSAKNGFYYRISVKREDGGVSQWLHDKAGVGSVLQAKAPRGAFTLSPDRTRPIMLVSAGVGLTPMVGMLDTLLIANGRCLNHAPIAFLHGAANGAVQAFKEWIVEKTKTHQTFSAHFVYSQPRPEDVLGRDYHTSGRIDADLVLRLQPGENCDFYLCGPASFMQDVYDGLRARGVSDGRIFAESFGPSRLKRRIEGGVERSAPVEFRRSEKQVVWQSANGSLLNLAESIGLEPIYSCRVGNCGSCRVRLISGEVEYEVPPVARMIEGHALICCARPKSQQESSSAPLVLDL